jgi:hypothetical protein
LLTPEESEVVTQVVTKMAGPPTPWRETTAASRWRTHPWLDHEELLSEAYIACMTTDVLTGATSLGAFHVRLRDKLVDAQKTECKWRNERTTSFEETEAPPTQVRTTAPEVKPDDYAPGVRSESLAALASMTKEEFVVWADQRLGRSYAKKDDVRSLLFGSTSKQAELWDKYARGKRVSGGKRVKIDGVDATPSDYQDTLAEEWKSRYRWKGGFSHPLVMSQDGETVEVARMLRQPVR